MVDNLTLNFSHRKEKQAFSPHDSSNYQILRDKTWRKEQSFYRDAFYAGMLVLIDEYW